MNKEEALKKAEDDKQQHINDAEKTLEELKTAKNNTDESNTVWEGYRNNRMSAVAEIIQFYKTGKKDHIKIKEYTEEEIGKSNIQHFK